MTTVSANCFRRAAVSTLLLVAACWLAGCSTTRTSREQLPEREAATPPQVADPAKRARARLELASAYFAQGQSDTALEEVNQALEADPKSADAYNLSGLIYASLADPVKADASFRHSLQLRPADGGTLHNYGWFQCQQGRYVEAQASFAQALAAPQYRDAVRTLLIQGVCYARDARLNEAEQTLNKAFDMEPGNAAVAVNLAEVLYRRGQYERARFYVRRVNGQVEQSTAQTLWLGVRIENRAGNRALMTDLANQLRNRFPQSREAAAMERGQFDD
jgi:type IV pilus assembly protein PilF